MKKTTLAATSLLLALAAGACASMTVSDDAIVQRASTSLGMERGAFTISDRVNEGMEVRFKATTKSGQVYNCSMAGSVSLLGTVPSDAICTPMNGGPATTCNALMKAANKC